MDEFSFTTELWRHHGEAAWHFVTLPTDVTDDIDELVGPTRPGFGSVRVEVGIGTTTWRTSLFPDSKAGSYVLPVKRAVRRAEQLMAGQPVDVSLVLVDAD